MRRAAAIWLLLFAAYASTLGLDARDGHDYAGDEAHHLLAARSLAEQGSFDVADDYRLRTYREFDAGPMEPYGQRTKGALNEPYPIGLSLLAAPLYALGGPKLVELLVAALAALAGALGYLLARRVVPEPWPTFAALGIGLSPPMLAYGTAVMPEAAAAAPLAGAAVLVARMREHRPNRREALACMALIGTLPWFGFKFLVPGLVVAVLAVRALRGAHRKFLALVSVEVALFAVALLIGFNEALFDGPTAHFAYPPGVTPTGAEGLGEHLERVHRLAGLFADRSAGLIRWAPLLALAFVGGWVLYRATRERLARAIAGLGEELWVGRMCTGTIAAALLVAVFLSPSIEGEFFPGRELIVVLPLTVPLVALGLRRLPRVGAALGALTLAASVWLWLDVRGGGSLIGDRPDAPWGPLANALPEFDGGPWPYVVTGAILLACAAPFIREEIAVRQRLP